MLDVFLANPKSAAAHSASNPPTDLDRAGATVHQDVLRLQIAVRDVLLVAVAHGLHQRLHHRARLVLVVELLLHDLVEQLAACRSLRAPIQTVHQLRHDVVVVLVVVEALQPHDVRVVQLLLTPLPRSHLPHDEHLVLQRLHVALLQIALLDALHRVPLVRLLVHRRVHHRVRARPQRLLDLLRLSPPSQRVHSDC